VNYPGDREGRVVSLLTVDVESRGKLSTERGTEQWRRSKSP
jgi:hypothetical protein